MHPSNKDQNFLETIDILNKNNVKYWICHGTLLGLIRDKQLIPWDHDIDIAVWSETISREKIKKIMLSNNFLLKEKYIEDSALAFEKKGGKDKKLYWLQQLNDIRKIIFHPSKGVATKDEVSLVREISVKVLERFSSNTT